MNHFFATISRMKYIERWALMRSSRVETLSEHSIEVAMIAHALCVIGNRRYGRHLDAEKAALIGIYHDASEIITGDMPTPVKYANKDLKNAFKDVERQAERTLLSELPADLLPDFDSIFTPENPDDEEEQYMRKLIKAADKLSAYIKCMEEDDAGNKEFRTAKETIRQAVMKLRMEYPEVQDFCREFLPSYGNTLDELLGDIQKDPLA
ncbi:MAG: 5'-deoxynucleotidase [Lachnospiraceae bacterium]|jgi:5'-deoxynucleotidase|nr:5'-deoxynucleotidase [Lachnospiraceae bacterium]MBQ1823080.1 5'-deoxynucleotidase [Lachnospiraceae bacterium]MCI7329019.1 5'-deoxynucleotidase [Lachnospiraceae bacterium]MDD7702330.1 5'-deoxynucleotidase [Lachnospiraceae bacterium]MDY3301262.1 5'-deoxynucleotidase [Lachnospiraceae bacterium]